MVDAQEQMSKADEYAVALVTAMLSADDSGDPAAWQALMKEGSQTLPASMVISSLASQASTLVRILAAQQQVPWQNVMQTLGIASQLPRDHPDSL
jgi:hypothetical protein